MKTIYRWLAIAMLISTGVIFLAACIVAAKETTFTPASKIWLEYTFWLSLTYAVIFLGLFAWKPPEAGVDASTATSAFIVSGVVLGVLPFGAYFLQRDSDTVAFQMLPSFVLAFSIVLFDIIMTKWIRIKGEWAVFIESAMAMDYSVAIALVAVFLFSLVACMAHPPVANKPSAIAGHVEAFSAGAAAFSLSISAVSFSLMLVREKGSPAANE